MITVLVLCDAAHAAFGNAVGEAFSGAGLDVLRVEPPEQTSDSEYLGVLGAAVRSAGSPRVVLGVGSTAGTVALMAPATVPGLAASVAIEPILVAGTLTANRPMQPLDFLPGCRVPLQVQLAADHEDVLPGHIAMLRDRLQRMALPSQVIAYDGCRGVLADETVLTELVIHRARAFCERIARRVQ